MAGRGVSRLLAVLHTVFYGQRDRELLALVWSFIAVGFLADALRCRSFVSAVAAIVFMTFAQQTRMGAVFVLPMLGLWALMAFSTRRTLVRDTTIVAAAIAGPILFSVLLAKLYGALNTTEGWNIAYVACALARDTSWYECDARERRS